MDDQHSRPRDRADLVELTRLDAARAPETVIDVRATTDDARRTLAAQVALLQSLEGTAPALPRILVSDGDSYEREGGVQAVQSAGRRRAATAEPTRSEIAAMAHARRALEGSLRSLHDEGWSLGARCTPASLGRRADGSPVVLDLSGLAPGAPLARRLADLRWIDAVLGDADRTLLRPDAPHQREPDDMEAEAGAASMSVSGAGDAIRPAAEPGADDTVLRAAAGPRARLDPASGTGLASTARKGGHADPGFIDAVPADLGVGFADGTGAGSRRVGSAGDTADEAPGGTDDSVVAELRRAHREATATRSAESARSARSGRGSRDVRSHRRTALRGTGSRPDRERSSRRRSGDGRPGGGPAASGPTGPFRRVRRQQAIALVAGALSLVVCSAIAAVLLPQLGSAERPADAATEARATSARSEAETPAAAQASATEAPATPAEAGAGSDGDPEAARAALAEPRAVVQSLADARTAHMVDGAPDRATVPGTAARSADDALAAQLDGAQITGWRTTVTSAQLIEADYGTGEAVVRAVVSDSAWTGTTSSGRTERHDAVEDHEITLRLRWHDGSWRIAEVA